MNLREYFNDTGIKISRFAERFGLTERTIHNVLKGTDIALSTAILIEEATGGKVKCKEMKPTKTRTEKRLSKYPPETSDIP